MVVDPKVEIIRSPKRKKTISGRWQDGRIVVRVPARLTRSQEDRLVADLVNKMKAKAHHAQSWSDEHLERRARALNQTYLESRAHFSGIRWADNQKHRWGSCTPDTGSIRISSQLKTVPGYVLDAVIVHELVHTFIPHHGPEFYQWANKVPHAERAQGYLEAYQQWGIRNQSL
ncbi:DUF45 domain-containing protein [Corynebacterium poyangense]|uniref:DUF45 domain-containing protein n=1 Tax=Corynebacterium poyangense TaxID=2684405 RepID=A0A7H0SMM6_9CORY|nr:SprT-like domain-containing protein [Corynebacterium poyangense]MBZ8176907.1 DUF45 domain-containing protein [Corynebacterium poyangense]QNQ89801.1 DUF45 domain-containing protein [Corynebacterium poyangense]